MKLYKAGQGLSKQSVERLKSRKEDQTQVWGNALPPEDSSEQWNRVIGAGAASAKKPRCATCTRPLVQTKLAIGQLFCGECSRAPYFEPPGLEQHVLQARIDDRSDSKLIRENQEKALICHTPSTEMLSEEECTSSIVNSTPPSPDQMTEAALRKWIGGDWEGKGGDQYRVSFDRNQKGISCVCKDLSGSEMLVSLFLDARDGLIWWGTDRPHFLDLSEISWTTDHVTWHDSGNGTRTRSDFEWHRPGAASRNTRRNKILDQTVEQEFESHKAKEDLSTEFEDHIVSRPRRRPISKVPIGARPHPEVLPSCLRSKGPIGAAPQVKVAPPQPPIPPGHADVPKLQRVGAWHWQPKLHCEQSKEDAKELKAKESKELNPGSLAARAIREVELQLAAPAADGFVWVDHWNERFMPSFGTLRSFLERHPERFEVIPTHGRGYRVALAGSRRWKRNSEKRYQ
mmetsp:Transcript_81394/g.143686  ORF Transcript_81394/g.143686 Transcript_81394/m.143686 type:complete len:457 (-) Transcript_81394:333-1703(-)